MWSSTVLVFVYFPSFLLAEISCPDGSKCSDGMQCCSTSPHSFECCEVWKHLIQEMEVAGREHVLGMPSEYGLNHSYIPCHRSTCVGTCCGSFCCSHRSAECCASAHQCCKVGYKCCGRRAWCCPWKLSCSGAHGYCISSTQSLKLPSVELELIILLLLFFCRQQFC